MLIFVKTITGKCINLEVSKYETIEDVKSKLNKREGIPACSQRLILKGGIGLHYDDMKLEDCGIESEDVVWVYYSTRGA
jgi:hypothetical protein